LFSIRASFINFKSKQAKIFQKYFMSYNFWNGSFAAAIPLQRGNLIAFDGLP
jgi:hypothetical protein